MPASGVDGRVDMFEMLEIFGPEQYRNQPRAVNNPFPTSEISGENVWPMSVAIFTRHRETSKACLFMPSNFQSERVTSPIAASPRMWTIYEGNQSSNY